MTTTSPARRTAAALLAGAALVALPACGSGGSPSLAAAPQIGSAPGAPAVESTPAAEDPTSVFSLEVGQCIDSEADSGEVGSVPVVECSQPHEGEIYALPQAPDGEFPGEDAMRQTAQDQCIGSAYTDYVGLPYEQSEFEITFLLPTEESWSGGDREIGCIVQNEEPGSVRGSNR